MPLDVRHERADGQQIGRTATDWDGLVERGAEELESVVLRAIDIYGDTVLSASEMPQLLQEWEAVYSLVRTGSDEACWLEVRELARLCQTNEASGLRFVGD